MSKSLKIVNGDFSIGAGRTFESVSNSDKLAQDLRLWVLERIGIDPSTPTYGNRLDGGIIDDIPVGSFIGQSNSDLNAQAIRAEIIDILGRYQQMQLEKIKREIIQFGGDHTLDEDEVLYSVENVEVSRTPDQVIVRCTCNTLSGRSLSLLIPVAS